MALATMTSRCRVFAASRSGSPVEQFRIHADVVRASSAHGKLVDEADFLGRFAQTARTLAVEYTATRPVPAARTHAGGEVQQRLPAKRTLIASGRGEVLQRPRIEWRGDLERGARELIGLRLICAPLVDRGAITRAQRDAAEAQCVVGAIGIRQLGNDVGQQARAVGVGTDHVAGRSPYPEDKIDPVAPIPGVPAVASVARPRCPGRRRGACRARPDCERPEELFLDGSERDSGGGWMRLPPASSTNSELDQWNGVVPARAVRDIVAADVEYAQQPGFALSMARAMMALMSAGAIHRLAQADACYLPAHVPRGAGRHRPAPRMERSEQTPGSASAVLTSASLLLPHARGPSLLASLAAHSSHLGVEFLFCFLLHDDLVGKRR